MFSGTIVVWYLDQLNKVYLFYDWDQSTIFTGSPLPMFVEVMIRLNSERSLQMHITRFHQCGLSIKRHANSCKPWKVCLPYMWRDLIATRALEIIHKNINIIIQQTLEEQADLERITDKMVLQRRWFEIVSILLFCFIISIKKLFTIL